MFPSLCGILRRQHSRNMFITNKNFYFRYNIEIQSIHSPMNNQIMITNSLVERKMWGHQKFPTIQRKK